MLSRAVRDLKESRDAMAWPTVAGQVTRSEMKVNTLDVRRRRSGTGPLRSSSEESYEAEIEYEFEIAGVIHKGNRRTAIPGGHRADKPYVQKTLDKYPVGQAVTVSYNPSDPRQSVLEPGS